MPPDRMGIRVATSVVIGDWNDGWICDETAVATAVTACVCVFNDSRSKKISIFFPLSSFARLNLGSMEEEALA